MRLTGLIAGLLAMGWAQAPRLRPISPASIPPHVIKKLREENAKRVALLPLSEISPSKIRRSESARTSIACDSSVFMPWLPSYLDADTIRPARGLVKQGLEDVQAGDTLMIRVPSRVLDTLIREVVEVDQNGNRIVRGPCFKPYFDSLNSQGAGGVVFNRIRSFTSDADYEYYTGNAVATRYEVPENAQPFKIVGIAFHLYNNLFTGQNPNRDCDLSSTPEGSPDFSNGNGLYEIFAQIRRARYAAYSTPDTVIYDQNGDSQLDTLSIPIVFTYPGSEEGDILAEVGWPVKQLRVSWLFAEGGQCVGDFDSPDPDWRTNMNVAYFPPEQQYAPAPGDTLYMVISSELYDPEVDGILDTLWSRVGPAYDDTTINFPLWALHDSLRGLAPKPEGVAVLNYLVREIGGPFVAEGWDPLSVFPSESRWIRNLYFNIYPVISQLPEYEPPRLPDYSDTVSSSLRWGRQGFTLPYPNPAIDCISVGLESPGAGMAIISLHTMAGRVIRRWERRFSSGYQKITVDLGDTPPGSYLLSVRTPFGHASFTILILR